MIPKILDQLDTPVERARLARAIIDLRDTKRLDSLLAAAAIIDLDSRSRILLNACLAPDPQIVGNPVIKRAHAAHPGQGRASSLSRSRSTLAYSAVVSSLEWRNSWPISDSDAPPRSSSVAAVCLSRWAVTSPIPARLLAETTTCVTPPGVSARRGAFARTNTARSRAREREQVARDLKPIYTTTRRE